MASANATDPFWVLRAQGALFGSNPFAACIQW